MEEVEYSDENKGFDRLIPTTDHRTNLDLARDALASAATTAWPEDALAAAISHILDHLTAQKIEASIQSGLDQAAAGETENLGNFAHYADTDPLDLDGELWEWCNVCDEFRVADYHKDLP